MLLTGAFLKPLKLIHKDLEDRNLLQAMSLKLEKIMNEKMSKRRIQIRDLQKQEIDFGRPENEDS